MSAQQHPQHPHPQQYHDIEEASATAARRRTSNLAHHGHAHAPPPVSSSSSQEYGPGGASLSLHNAASQPASAAAGDPLLSAAAIIPRAPPSRGSASASAGLCLPLTVEPAYAAADHLHGGGHLHHNSSSGGGGGAHQHPPQAPLRLLHPLLNRVPLQFRFGATGFLSNALFMVAYNASVVRFGHGHAGGGAAAAAAAAPGGYKPSAIYGAVYLLFIPVGHVLSCLLVFGWPARYLPSLLSNLPIGLTALAIGSLLTSYLDSIDFNYRIEEYIRDNYSFSKMPARNPLERSDELYSSLVVLAVTSLWTYALSVFVNAPPDVSDKKRL